MIYCRSSFISHYKVKAALSLLKLFNDILYAITSKLFGGPVSYFPHYYRYILKQKCFSAHYY